MDLCLHRFLGEGYRGYFGLGVRNPEGKGPLENLKSSWKMPHPFAIALEENRYRGLSRQVLEGDPLDPGLRKVGASVKGWGEPKALTKASIGKDNQVQTGVVDFGFWGDVHSATKGTSVGDGHVEDRLRR